MSDDTFHRDKAIRNYSFFTSTDLDNTSYPEWAVVVLFYECLHYVDAILWKDNSLPADLRSPCDHWHRREALRNCPTLSNVAPFYLSLYDRSRDSRYTRLGISSTEYHKIKMRTIEPMRARLKGLLGIK